MSLDYETLRVIWWLFIVVLMIGFALTDGFDLGIAILLPFVGQTDIQRRVMINSIGPTWDGNQVWFVAAGGALFAAWPLVYAAAFSGLYVALLLSLFALFFRPLGFDYRSKIDHPRWRSFWDWGLFAGGLVPTLIFGVAFGNLLLGLPFHFDSALRSYYTGSFWGLFSPFSVLAGIISVTLMVMHGAIYLQIKTERKLATRSKKVGVIAAIILMTAFALAGLLVAYGIDGYRVVSLPAFDALPNPLAKIVEKAPGAWMDNYTIYPRLRMVPITVFVAGTLTILFSLINRPGIAFITSGVSVACVIATASFSMFPFIMPSSSNLNSSLTVWDASSSHTTLTIMFWVTVIFLPIVITYTAWVYRVLRGKVTEQDIQRNDHSVY